MQKCNRCRTEKSLSEFYKNKVSNTGYCKTCVQCQKEIRKKSYTIEKKDKIVISNAARRAAMHKFVNEIKAAPCTDCGKTFPHYCMDFDHLGDKILAVAHMVHNNHSIEKIKKEIAKCELVCAICHRDRTYKRLQESKKSLKDNWDCIERNRKIIIDNKSVPCSMCHIQYDYWLMDYDHIDPLTKNKCVAHLLASSEEVLKKEIEKCQVLCAICHRLKTKETRDSQSISSQIEITS